MDSQKTIQVESNDFLCTLESVFDLLGRDVFYTKCPKFNPLKAQLAQVAEFVKTQTKCSGCTYAKVQNAKRQIIDNFARVVFWLADNNKTDELAAILKAVTEIYEIQYNRLLLVYAGKAANNQKRTVVVNIDGTIN